ncbi:response regulator [Mucilaginibacter conchicola]|uniref:Response regulator n=1 Tax=Mucilaginibacter conchicola TaxID=2303333 RepID=A0A372NNS9_9SPHI|nr:response regulator [Mucilaginibacter conchicola]RFZ89893.1 response regulator [Mucilaginibacter conchicola]
MQSTGRPADIYVIDDQPIDNIIFKLLFKKYDDRLKIHVLDNAEAAIEDLKNTASNAPESFPGYIFLDLNMQKMDGWQFLQEYERLGFNKLKRTQIFILSSSLYQKDLQKSQSNPLVRDFISKPLRMERIHSILHPA